MVDTLCKPTIAMQSRLLPKPGRNHEGSSPQNQRASRASRLSLCIVAVSIIKFVFALLLNLTTAQPIVKDGRFSCSENQKCYCKCCSKRGNPMLASLRILLCMVDLRLVRMDNVGSFQSNFSFVAENWPCSKRRLRHQWVDNGIQLRSNSL